MQNIPYEHSKTIRRLEIFSSYFEDVSLHTFLHLLLIHGIVPNSWLGDTAYTIMGQAWSLTLEFQFYLVAPFIIALIYSSKPNFTFTLLCLLSFEFALQGVMGHNSFFFAYSQYFVIGILSYLLYESFSINKKSQKQFLLYSALLFSLSLLYLKTKGNWLSLMGLVIWVLVYYSEYFTDRQGYKFVTKIPNLVIRSKLMLYFGKISYSMYCSHMIFLYLCSYLATAKEVGLNLYGLEYVLFMSIIPIFATIVFSSISFQYIEKPFINLGKKIFLPKS